MDTSSGIYYHYRRFPILESWESENGQHCYEGSNYLADSNKIILADFPWRFSNLKEDAHLSIYLGKQSDFNTDDVASKWPVQFSKPPFDMRLYLQEITKMIYHWACPRISERDLSAPQPLRKSGPDYRFITFLHPRWVFYWRLGSNKTEMDSFRYNLLVLQCLKNTPGINQFLGVVLDDRNLINGFLYELPAKGSLLAVITRAFESYTSLCLYASISRSPSHTNMCKP